MSSLYDNIQTSRLTITGDSRSKNVLLKENGMMKVDKFTFSDDGEMVINGRVEIINSLDIDTIYNSVFVRGNITVNPGKLKTNYLSPIVGDTIIFNSDIETAAINEKNFNEGVLIDGVLIKGGEFYVNGTKLAEAQSKKNAPGGYVGLDVNGKASFKMVNIVGTVQIDGDTTIPNLVDGIGTLGECYLVDGTGESVVYNGTKWVRIPENIAVASVNGKCGVVNLRTDDIPEDGPMYLTDDRIDVNVDVVNGYNHISLMTGNVHNLTAEQVGNTVAQWNAQQLQGRNISKNVPNDGEYLMWNANANEWKPSMLPVVAEPPGVKMECVSDQIFHVSGNTVINVGWVINYVVAGFNFENGVWTFPEAGNYRIIWGAVCENSCRLILNIDGNDVSIIDASSEMRAVWYQNVRGGATGRINVSGSGATLRGYYITIDKW